MKMLKIISNKKIRNDDGKLKKKLLIDGILIYSKKLFLEIIGK